MTQTAKRLARQFTNSTQITSLKMSKVTGLNGISAVMIKHFGDKTPSWHFSITVPYITKS